MRLVVIWFLIFSSVWSIEIDRDTLRSEIENNPDNINLRVVLARTYISQSDFEEAKKLLDEVLRLENDNSNALSLIEDIKKIKKFTAFGRDKKVSNSQKLISYSENLYKNREYKEIINMHKVLKRNNILFDSHIDLDAIWSSIYIKDYDTAFKIIKGSSLSLGDKYYLKIKVHEAKGEYLISEQLYLEALKSGDREDIVVGLYELYLKQYKHKKAKKLLDLYIKRAPKSSITLALLEKAPPLVTPARKMSPLEKVKEEFFKLKDAGKNDKALKKLSQFVKKNPKNEEATLILAKHLYWEGKIQKSLTILKPFIGKTNNKEILAQYADILLQNAIKEYKAENYVGALEQYLAYYKISKDVKVFKEISEIYFIQDKFESSLPYYETYLKLEPNDYKVRFRYANALQMQKQYEKAEIEYEKVASVDSEIYELSLYRYATMLMVQEDEQKWNKSREVFKKLKKELEAQKPQVKRDTLLEYTEIALNKVNKPMPKPQKYKDIMLLPNQKKIVKNDNVFEYVSMEKRDVISVKSMFGQTGVTAKKSVQKDIEFNLHRFEDNSIDNLSLGIRVNNIARFKDVLLSLETKKSKIKTNELEYLFDSFYTHFSTKNLSVQLGINKFKEFEDLYLELLYRKAFAGHQMTFGLGYKNVAFINSLAYMIKHKIKAVQFSLYDAILLTNLKEAEVSLQLNIYSDENININSWLNYPIYKMVHENFENAFSLTGSYLYNTKTDTGYYPSRFFDGNYITMRPTMNFGTSHKIGGSGGVGYSISSENILYNYGLYAQFLVYKLFSVSIDCRHYQSGYSPDGANECYAKAAYKW